ncbi:MAG TPA: BatD family protein, partial [Thermoanaerobaculia bacterium]|nr:BatD family protein [Thermoanaerobaculia bacterium]
MSKGVLFFALVLLFPVMRVSAQPDVSIDVEKRPALNQTIRLTYTFSGTGSVRVPPLVPLKNLSIVGGPSTSTQISFINGELSRSVALTYYLRARATGPAEIGEVHFLFGDKIVKAAAQTLEVEAARAGAGASDPNEEDPLGGFPVRQLVPGVRASRRASVVDYAATPEKTSAFVGEEVT